MNQITPHALWVGHSGDGRDFQKVMDASIRALVQLDAEGSPIQPPRELIYCRFPLIDGAGNAPELLSLAASTVATLLRRKVPTLVFCGSGLSRSPAVSAIAMAIAERQSPETCLQQIAKYHACDVSPGLWKDLNKHSP